MRTRPARKLLSAGIGLAVLVCLWLYVAPTGIGGSTTYIVTEGVSMQPRFHGGDLALVRAHGDYRVGEIVAYRSRVFHTIVLHRIIAIVGERYVFKGDNNNFVDFERPTRDQLIGSLWIHIPGAGAELESLRSPALIGLLFGLSVLLLTGARFTRERRRRRRQRHNAGEGARGAGGHRIPGRSLGVNHPSGRGPGAHRPPDPRLPGYSSAPLHRILPFALTALIPVLALGLLAFTRPTGTLVAVNVPYTQSGALSYSAQATPGPAYPENRAVTGEPLFTHVVKVVDLRFEYGFHSSAPHSLSGTASLYAKITSSNGWQTTVPLGPSTEFQGDQAIATGRLDLGALLALVRRVQASTEVNGTYTLTLIPRIRVDGSLGMEPLRTTFSPRAQFSFEPLEAQPTLPTSAAATLAGGSPPSAGGTAAINPFAQSTQGSLAGKRQEPTFLSIAIARLTVATARSIALGGIALIVLALLAALALGRARPREEAAAILARYGRSIVPVAHVGLLPGVAVIDVADIEALVRVAEHYDRSILHEVTETGNAFWVTDESGQFRYAIGAPADVQAPEGENEDEQDLGYDDGEEEPDYDEEAYEEPDYDEESYDESEEPETLVHETYADELGLAGIVPGSELPPPASAAAQNGRLSRRGGGDRVRDPLRGSALARRRPKV